MTVIQQRLRNHDDFGRLSKSDYLQTTRVITNIGTGEDSRILNAYLKPIVGRNIIDNHDCGRTGNLLARIDQESGMLQAAVRMSAGPQGIETVAHHPDTGYALADFAIPHWSEVCAFSHHAARIFIPIQTIGWDIAVPLSDLIL